MGWPEVTIGQCRLILGDCREVLPTLTGIGAIVTDPPYGIAYASGGQVRGKWRHVRHQGVRIYGDERPFDPAPLLALAIPLILWGANFYSDALPGGGWLVWDKRHGMDEMSFNRSDAELAYISGKKTVTTFRYLWHGLCRGGEVGEHYHPTQKPVAVMRHCLAFVPGALPILDPYMGSGSTGVACAQLGRAFIGIEIEPRYFDIACRRIEKANAQPDLFVSPKGKPQQLSLGVL